MGNDCCRASSDIPDGTRSPIPTVQGGSQVYIRAQDPTVKLALKIIHLPQEIISIEPEGPKPKPKRQIIHIDINEREENEEPGSGVSLKTDKIRQEENDKLREQGILRNGDINHEEKEKVSNGDNIEYKPVRYSKDEAENEMVHQNGVLNHTKELNHQNNHHTYDAFAPYAVRNQQRQNHRKNEKNLHHNKKDTTNEIQKQHSTTQQNLKNRYKVLRMISEEQKWKEGRATRYMLGTGPRTDDIVIELVNMDVKRVNPTRGSDYLYNPDKNPAEFDAINCLATCQLILNLYRRCLWENGDKNGLSWRWGSEPLHIYPWAHRLPNSYYVREEGTIRLGYYKQKEHTKFHCRSFDIIAHEVGHALLDGLKPGLLDEMLLQGVALHEAFADMTVLFGLLEHPDICEAVLRVTGGDLHKKNFLPIIAESLGTQGLRNLDQDYKISDVTEEPHELSLVLSGAVYDVLVDIFNLRVSQNTDKDKTQLLCETGRYLLGITLMSFKEAPDQKITLRDVARSMMALEKDEVVRELMENQFSRRELLELDINPKPVSGYSSSFFNDKNIDIHLSEACCKTLHMSCKKSKTILNNPNISVINVA